MASILGIGVDIVALPRLRALINRRGPDRLALRILSSHEHREWHDRHAATIKWDAERELRFLAVRSAASPKPALQVDPPPPSQLAASSSATTSTATTFHLSVAHDGDYVVAYVVATS
ncbi:hypothetical protein RQP46_008380 [Phenoliferia psychrophenolica]